MNVRRRLSPLLLVLLTALGLYADLGYDPSFVGATVVQNLVNGQLEAVHRFFDGRMKNALPPDAIRSIWQRVQKEAGPLRYCGEARSSRESEAYMSVYVPCQFERAALDVKLALDVQGFVTGMVFVPSKEPPSSALIRPAEGGAASNPDLPDYLRGASFDESPVTIGKAPWLLDGTLTVPKGPGPFPALVLVHGSGPLDRDSTVGGAKPFRDLAFGLSARGIAVLRYVKRSKEYGARLAGIKKLTVKEEVLDDAAAALDLLRSSARIDKSRLYVLGHSLGGMLVPRIGRAHPDLAGLIVAAANARPIQATFVEQALYLEGLSPQLSGIAAGTPRKSESAKAELARIDAVSPADAEKGTVMLGMPAAYWLDLKGYRPAEEARALPQPILVLHGDRDYQATEADLSLWREALSGRPGCVVKTFPSLNHLLVAGVGPSVPKEYETRGYVAAEVMDAIVAFVGVSAPAPKPPAKGAKAR